jgi:3-hydroxyisobutyrate dehydrogenase-like beta-hydroxyacid dehydrogenase
MNIAIAVIAAGAMGAGVGARLTENGLTVLTSLAGRGEESRKRAAAARMQDADDAAIAAADIILSIVPPAEAENLARRLAPALTAATCKPLFVDCNAINPETVGRIAAIIAPTGCGFVDAGIIGGPPKPGTPGPRFYFSGADSARAMALKDYGLVSRDMGGKVGDASALKMCYGAFNKGLVALGSAVTLAAERNGVATAFKAELAESQAPMLAQLTRGVPDMFPKAYRWVAEFEEVAEFVGERPEREIFAGIARLYQALADDVAGDRAETGKLAAFFAGKSSETGH